MLGGTTLNLSPVGKKIKTVFFRFLIIVTIGMISSQVLYADEDLEEPKPDTYNKLKVFSEILSLIESNYVEPLASDTMVDGAIKGMVKALDPHTSYLPPVSYKEMQVQTTGKFGGLGIEISIRDGVLTVVSPIEGTPAFKVGVKPGDRR